MFKHVANLLVNTKIGALADPIFEHAQIIPFPFTTNQNLSNLKGSPKIAVLGAAKRIATFGNMGTIHTHLCPGVTRKTEN